MPTSNSIDYQLTTNQLIEEAYDICGVGSEGEGISADQYARGKRSLNTMVKAWSASDHLWLRTDGSKVLVAATSSYALTPKPLRILDARRKDTSNIETPMREWSRAEYLDMPNKTSTGVPVNFYYDPQRDTGTMYVWPTPGATEASEYTVEFTYLRRMDDFDGTADAPDLPQEWLEALTFGLAERLALKYVTRPDLRAEISARAVAYKAELNAWDTEPASLFMQPEYE